MAYPVYEGNGGIADGGDYAVDVPWVDGAVENDIMLVMVGDADNDTFGTPSNWNPIHSDSANAAFSYAAFWHRVTTPEEFIPPTDVTFTSVLDAGSPVAGVMARFSGCITTGTPYEDSDEDVVAKGTVGNIPAMTSGGVDRFAVWMLGVEDNLGISDDATNYAQEFRVTTSLGGDMDFAFFTQQTGSGTVAADSCTIGGSDYNGSVGVVLIPPAGATTHDLAGTIGVVSAFTGDLDLLEMHQLAGTVGITSAFTGDLTMVEAQWALAGAVGIQSVFTGDLGAPYKLHQLAGAVGIQSAFTGDLTKIEAQWALAGSIGIQSAFTGDLTKVEAEWALAGAVGIQSVFTGDLGAPYKLHQLAGAVGIQSAFTGDLTKIEAQWALAGSIGIQSAFTGDLTKVEAEWALAGAVGIQSAFTGDLTIDGGATDHVLAGAIASQTTFTGDLTKVEAQWALAGAIAAQSSFVGDLTMEEAQWALAGAIGIQSVFTGDLTKVEADWALAGTVGIQSAFTGDLVLTHAQWTLTGAVGIQSAFIADLTVSSGTVVTLDIDSAGKPIVYEGVVAKITGINGDVSNDDDVAVILDGSDVSLFVNGVQIGATATLGTVLTGTTWNVADDGDGANSLEIWPRDVSSLLPVELT